MGTFRCPHCGSPVMLRGSWWECGWCGDSGRLAPPRQPEPAVVSDEDVQALERGVWLILQGVQAQYGDGGRSRTLSLEMAVYGMSHALLAVSCQTPRNRQLLQAFFQIYSFCTAEQVLGAARSGEAAFAEKYTLTKERLGSFWQSVLAELPGYQPYRAWPGWLEQILDGLGQVESCFSGRGEQTEHDALWDALAAHWSVYAVRHPDRARLEEQVRRWDLEENEWACRDLLIAAFPQAVSCWTADQLTAMETGDLLTGVGERSPETAADMVKLLLDTADAHLGEDDTAQQLLGLDMDNLFCIPAVQKVLLHRLKTDDKLARQIFQSACAEPGQWRLYQACDTLGEPELKEKLSALMRQNPYFAEDMD